MTSLPDNQQNIKRQEILDQVKTIVGMVEYTYGEDSPAHELEKRRLKNYWKWDVKLSNYCFHSN